MPLSGWTSGRPLVFLFSFKSNCTKNFNLQHRSNPLFWANKKNTTQIMRVCFFLVGVTGFEPMASWSRTMRATICATPR